MGFRLAALRLCLSTGLPFSSALLGTSALGYLNKKKKSLFGLLK
jgi:hypothetical protein